VRRDDERFDIIEAFAQDVMPAFRPLDALAAGGDVRHAGGPRAEHRHIRPGGRVTGLSQLRVDLLGGLDLEGVPRPRLGSPKAARSSRPACWSAACVRCSAPIGCAVQTRCVWPRAADRYAAEALCFLAD
jgi:hypothetical protein